MQASLTRFEPIALLRLVGFGAFQIHNCYSRLRSA